jgi:hypothetical protein
MRRSVVFRVVLLGVVAGAILAIPSAGPAAVCPQSVDVRCPPPCDPAACPTPCPLDPTACPSPPDPCLIIDPCQPPNPCVTIDCIRQVVQNLCEKLQLCTICPQGSYYCPPPCYQTAFYCPPPCYVVEGDVSYVCPAPCPPPLICVEPAS